jgi:hypothetical protein
MKIMLAIIFLSRQKHSSITTLYVLHSIVVVVHNTEINFVSCVNCWLRVWWEKKRDVGLWGGVGWWGKCPIEETFVFFSQMACGVLVNYGNVLRSENNDQKLDIRIALFD